LPYACTERAKHFVEAEIVGHARELRRIGERDRRQRCAVLPETAGPFLGEVHRVTHAAAVAARHEQAAALQRLRRGLHETTHAVEAGGIGQEGLESRLCVFERGAHGISGLFHGSCRLIVDPRAEKATSRLARLLRLGKAGTDRRG